MSFHTPSDPRNNSIMARARNFLRRLVSAHPSITDAVDVRRAELLSMISLFTGLVLVAAVLFQPARYAVFLALTVIALTAYVFGRTSRPWIGAYLFTYLFTTIGLVSVFQGTAESIEASIAYTALASFLISSVLLSGRGLLGLIFISIASLFIIPFFILIPGFEMDALIRSGGLILVAGAMLFGINIFRDNLDKEKNREINNINQDLENAKGILEQRLHARALELKEAAGQIEERTNRLQILSEISQEITTHISQNPKDYLTHIARMISEKLGYYHVGIFMINENQEYAVLRAANSKGGQQMLARRHQLKVGGAGIVGYVSQSRRPRIALDTGVDAVFFNNPDLPETRSEIAIPLKYGATIIGVLDVQSNKPSAFKAGDGITLETLANQIAIAISSQQSGGPAESLPFSKSISRHGGSHLGQRQAHPGYSFSPDGTLTNATPGNNPILNKALASGETVILDPSPKGIVPALAVPVKLRDQVIGVIHIEAADPKRKWSEDELALVQAISERAALALENARLFENATRRAEQEETIARVTTKIGSSTDFNHILQTTIQELGQALGVSRSFIQLKTPSNDDQGSTSG